MKLVITAGGGGHFSPAVAVLQQLPKETEVLFIGRKYAFEKDKTISFEYTMAKELGIPFQPLATGRLQRTFTKYTFRSLLRTPQGLTQALSILRKYRPDAVLSFGGYVSLPVTIAAYLLRIPVVIHEQTMSAGLSNKIASNYARTVCISWKSSEIYFPSKKVVLTGNPLREEMTNEQKDSTHPFLTTLDKPLIYITGGSLGSHRLNILVAEAIPELLKKCAIFHQTGDAQEFGDFDTLTKLREKMPGKNHYFLQKFLSSQEVSAVFHKATLIIGRSGASTMLEILYFGKPAILFPLLTGQKNEQEVNAQFLKKVGIAEVVDERIATASDLILLVEQMFAKMKGYEDSAQEAKKFIYKDSAKRIITEVSKAVSEKENHQKSKKRAT